MTAANTHLNEKKFQEEAEAEAEAVADAEAATAFASGRADCRESTLSSLSTSLSGAAMTTEAGRILYCARAK